MRSDLCLGATATVMQDFVDLDRAMAFALADEDLSTAVRRPREASEHARATARALEAGCPTPHEVARLSPASREQVVEWYAGRRTGAWARARTAAPAAADGGPVGGETVTVHARTGAEPAPAGRATRRIEAHA